jgi:hypothetical protein
MFKNFNEKEIVDFLNPERCYNIGEYLFHNLNDLKKALFQDFSVVTTNEVNNNGLAGFYTRWDFGETPVLICLALPGVLSLQLYDLLFSTSPSCSNNLPEEEKNITIWVMCFLDYGRFVYHKRN